MSRLTACLASPALCLPAIASAGAFTFDDLTEPDGAFLPLSALGALASHSNRRRRAPRFTLKGKASC